MEQLSLVTAFAVLCILLPTTVSHKLLHAGELINRENAKIRLGQLKALYSLRNSLVISPVAICHKFYRDWHKGERLPSQEPFIWRLGEDVVAVREQPICLRLDWCLLSTTG